MLHVSKSPQWIYNYYIALFRSASCWLYNQIVDWHLQHSPIRWLYVGDVHKYTDIKWQRSRTSRIVLLKMQLSCIIVIIFHTIIVIQNAIVDPILHWSTFPSHLENLNRSLTWLPLRHFRIIHWVRNLPRQKRLLDCNQGVAIGRQEVANRATGSTYRQEEGNRKRGSGRDRKYIQKDWKRCVLTRSSSGSSEWTPAAWPPGQRARLLYCSGSPVLAPAPQSPTTAWNIIRTQYTQQVYPIQVLFSL